MENKRIHSWLQKVEQEAYELGLSYFIAVGEGMLGNANVRMNNVCGNSNITDIINNYQQLKKNFSRVTFGDLYEYIQTADRNEFGYHYAFGNNKDIVFHIYENRRQVNICFLDDNNIHTSKLNIIYDPECSLVTVVPVENGIALYDNAKTISFRLGNVNDEPVKIGKYKPLLEVGFNDSETEFMNTYKMMVSIISDVLGPWKAANEK